MSRTYHHGNRAIEIVNGKWMPFFPELSCNASPKRKRRDQRINWMRTPMWWIHEFHEAPHRARCRNLMSKIKDGSEDVVIPHFKIPHIYFW